jgi:hypothetical protein
MLKLRRDIGINAIEQILQLPACIDIGDIREHLHLLLEFILEEAIMDSYNSLYVDVLNGVFH